MDETTPRREDMSSIKTTARQAGLFYLVMGLPAVLSLQYLPSAFIVPGDAAATASKITDGALLYRLLVLADLVSQIGFLFLVWTLYRLFRDVDRKLAMLLVILVSVSATVGIASTVNLMAPLAFLGGSDFPSVFSKPQVDALAVGFLQVRNYGLAVDAAFWGLWLVPFGLLVIKSRFIPKILGVFLIIGCPAYLALCVTSIVFPAYVHVVYQIGIPFFAIAELPIMLWLLVKGANVRLPESRPSPVS